MTESEMFEMLWDAPMSNRGSLRVKPTEVRREGMEHGKITVVGARRIPGLGDTLTLHEAGRSYWAARGRRGYGKARTYVVLVSPFDADASATTRLLRYVELSDGVDVQSSEAERDAAHAQHHGRMMLGAVRT